MVEVAGRVYVKATATLRDGDQCYTNTAFAREPDEKKGMDESQITGTASSYARKYCLNGLFLIDDTKDADTDEYAKQTKGAESVEPNTDKITPNMAAAIREIVKKNPETYSEKGICKAYRLKKLEDMTLGQHNDFIGRINK
jgi:hypothetical protein